MTSTFLIILTSMESPYKVFNLLAVANMSEKYLRIFGGDDTPPFGVRRTPLSLGVQRKPPSIRLKDENF